ncbi:DUF4386 domain-containing protein [Galbibacter sp. EGI 63066]|uniref:DUF4386 domain-containing protein n=1 Tax=Galbibacter sp. EGI 63066 TaxID=2993559 RepID=UPI0022493FD5|nr:DUF4386 domain-containing protein [Galbibacter sp. EGI 63066]MCX2681283.1 DUF4386 domain-containing protein [Galbibacter sp. EGI 63066]
MTKNNSQRQLITTAKVTGVWYLIMAISGMLGFIVFHPQIFVSNDPEKTLTNLINLESLSRIRLLFEFVLIIAQALTAVWFYRLFKDINNWAAWAVGIWGMMNSAAIMISAISMSSAIEIASSSIQTHEDKVILIELLGNLITNAWGVGSLFFGLWLIPMGYIIIRSKRMPIWLGRTLIIGGIGYLLSTFINCLGLNSPFLQILVIPATVGEFWMIGYLLIYGIRPMNN